MHKQSKTSKEDTLRTLILQLEERFFSEEDGVAVSNCALREKLLDELDEYKSQVKGAQGTRNGE